MQTAIKKGMGLDRIVGDYVPGALETSSAVSFNENTVDRLTRKYLFYLDYLEQLGEEKNKHLIETWQGLRVYSGAQEQNIVLAINEYLQQKLMPLLEKYNLDNSSSTSFLIVDHTFNLYPPVVDVLVDDETCTPGDIDVFLQSTVAYENISNHDEKRSLFVNKLIQHAYTCGRYTDFVLHTQGLTSPRFLLEGLKGSTEKPLCVTVEGSLGDSCAREVKYCTLAVNGDVQGTFGYKAMNSSFTVNGTLNGNAFDNAVQCTISLSDWVNPSTYMNVRNSTIRVTDEKTIDRFIDEQTYRSLERKGAKLIFVKNGKDILIGRWQQFWRYWTMELRVKLWKR